MAGATLALRGLDALASALASALATVLWVEALLALCVRFASTPRPRVRRLADASYAIYLLHLPLVLAGQIALFHSPLPGPLRGAAVFAATLALLLGGYAVWVRMNSKRGRCGRRGRRVASGLQVRMHCPKLGAMSTIRFYHNPRCSKSRAALALLRERGVEPELIEYLQQPPDRATLAALLRDLDRPFGEAVRRDARFAELGLSEADVATREQVLEVLLAHPELLERPLLRVGARVTIGRPPERVLELLAQAERP